MKYKDSERTIPKKRQGHCHNVTLISMLKEISLVESHSQASKEATASFAVHETVGDGMEERS
jgi:hypothetical protein